jgi:hypothetical protein
MTTRPTTTRELTWKVVFCETNSQIQANLPLNRNRLKRDRLVRASDPAQSGDQCGVHRSQHEGAFCHAGQYRACSSPADFGKLIVDETEKWAKGVKVAWPLPATFPRRSYAGSRHKSHWASTFVSRELKLAITCSSKDRRLRKLGDAATEAEVCYLLRS